MLSISKLYLECSRTPLKSAASMKPHPTQWSLFGQSIQLHQQKYMKQFHSIVKILNIPNEPENQYTLFVVDR